jgi:hypothetical protein
VGKGVCKVQQKDRGFARSAVRNDQGVSAGGISLNRAISGIGESQIEKPQAFTYNDLGDEGISEEMCTMLHELFEPYDRRLYELLGQEEWGGARDN